MNIDGIIQRHQRAFEFAQIVFALLFWLNTGWNYCSMESFIRLSDILLAGSIDGGVLGKVQSPAREPIHTKIFAGCFNAKQAERGLVWRICRCRSSRRWIFDRWTPHVVCVLSWSCAYEGPVQYIYIYISLCSCLHCEATFSHHPNYVPWKRTRTSPVEWFFAVLVEGRHYYLETNKLSLLIRRDIGWSSVLSCLVCHVLFPCCPTTAAAQQLQHQSFSSVVVMMLSPPPIAQLSSFVVVIIHHTTHYSILFNK